MENTSVVEVERAVGPLLVVGRIEVTGLPASTANYKAKSLAERIQRAVNTAILNFEDDFKNASNGG